MQADKRGDISVLRRKEVEVEVVEEVEVEVEIIVERSFISGLTTHTFPAESVVSLD